MDIFLILLIPFLGACLGSAIVFLIKDNINNRFEKLLIGFASGVMISASVFSLLLPSIERAEEQKIISWLPASIGFVLGILFLLVLDLLIPHLHIKNNEQEGMKTKFKRTTMIALALTLHNIPEGMAVGVALAGVFFGNEVLLMSSAIVLAIGMAIQNFPEGVIISMPLKAEGKSKLKSFGYGVLFATVEPIASIITMFLASLVIPIFPYVLSFAAGAMIYVVVEDLIPQLQENKHSNVGVIGVAIGFVIMMILNIGLA